MPLQEIDPGPVKKISDLTEFVRRLQEVSDRYYDKLREAKAQYEYERDLIEIAYYGPRWLVDGKVGGWDEE